jgi:copper ion binding protein
MKEKLKEENIDVKGMSCLSCVQKIEKRLSKLKGIEEAKANLAKGKVYVKFNPKIIRLDEIKAEIEDLGYKTDLNSEGQKSGKKSLVHGIIYGLAPHSFCIGFILASIVGATTLTQLFKPLLLNPNFLYILIAISFFFATISAIVYFKKLGFISIRKNKYGLELNIESEGIKRKWKYLSTLYGTTIGVNLLFFLIIFPILTNMTSGSALADVYANSNSNNIQTLRLQVDIPCSGHAPLITSELKSISGVINVKYSFPNIFDVYYDASKTSKEQILSLDVFKTYKASVLGSVSLEGFYAQSNSNSNQNLNGLGCGAGGCGCGCGRR